jgi:hypothetical protein
VTVSSAAQTVSSQHFIFHDVSVLCLTLLEKKGVTVEVGSLHTLRLRTLKLV